MSQGPAIPGFRFVQHLGSGRFADVHLYEQDSPSRRLAVRVLRLEVPLTDGEQAMVSSHAAAMAALADHPAVVPVVASGTTSPEQGARPYLAMRYCPPPDLGAQVRAQPMSVPDAVATGIKLAGAVETAHRSGILHGDIRPSHVLVTPDHEPALTGFVIGGVGDAERDLERPAASPWSPPELLDGRSTGSVSSDVYSLGATVWTLLTGRPPFADPGGGEPARALSARILHTSPPRTQRADVPPELEELLAQCLAKAPEHRPASALELAQGLRRVESEAGFAPTAVVVTGDPGGRRASYGETSEVPAGRIEEPTGAAPVPPRVPKGRIPPTVWWGSAAVVLVVLGALLVWRAATAGDGSVAPGITAPTSRATGAPGVVPPPTVSAHRAGRNVAFRWRASDTPHAGDSYEWRIRGRRGASHLTNGTTTTVRATARTCLQVRLARPGLPPSTWATACA